jgi:hypothetical protein
MRWRGLALPRGPSTRLLGRRVPDGHHRCQIPAVRASRPALPTFPGFPLGRIPSSVVRDFYCQSRALHKTFPRYLQDSLAVHRTSVVYPLCMADFHCPVHNFIHIACGLPAGALGERAHAGHGRKHPVCLCAGPVGLSVYLQRAQKPRRGRPARLGGISPGRKAPDDASACSGPRR